MLISCWLKCQPVLSGTWEKFQLDAICSLTSRCRQILNTAPLINPLSTALSGSDLGLFCIIYTTICVSRFEEHNIYIRYNNPIRPLLLLGPLSKYQSHVSFFLNTSCVFIFILLKKNIAKNWAILLPITSFVQWKENTHLIHIKWFFYT